MLIVGVVGCTCDFSDSPQAESLFPFFGFDLGLDFGLGLGLELINYCRPRSQNKFIFCLICYLCGVGWAEVLAKTFIGNWEFIYFFSDY